jgi:hypothetical protein
MHIHLYKGSQAVPTHPPVKNSMEELCKDKKFKASAWHFWLLVGGGGGKNIHFYCF